MTNNKMYSIDFLTENQEIIEQVNAFVRQWEDVTQTTMTSQTSGSTGKPKIITLEKRFMRASALASGKFFHFQKGQRIRVALSPTTIGGKMLLLRGLLHEMEIEIVTPSKDPLEKVEKELDFISLVPYQLEYLLENNAENLAKVKTILLGGAPVSESLQQKIQSLSCNVFLSYGMTETMSHVALKNLKSNQDDFQAIDGVTFTTDENQRLIIDSESLGLHHLQTNDVVELISATQFRWKGRADFVINSAGVKIHPEEVEKKLAKIISSRFFIIGEKNDKFGKQVVLVIEDKNSNEIIDFQSVLAKYEIPKAVYYWPKFEETASGKINRLATKTKIDAAKTNR